MKAKKIFVGATVSLALLINPFQVSADEVETFGEDFDGNNSEVVPFQNEEDEDIGDILIFNDPENTAKEKTPVVENPPVTQIPPVNEKPLVSENEQVVVEPTKQYPERERILPPSRIKRGLNANNTQKKLKTQKQRFVKLAIDETYTYYLDKQSVVWKRIPYSASEYMLDVWVRMIEKNPDLSDLPEDLSDYIRDKSNGEIEVAAERGLAFTPSDVEVLQNKKYFLEHYYLRPKTKQIQFLCELEVVGHPQNTITEREYDYRNWENLIPGSIESIIYQMTIKEVGKSGNSEHGHMSFADMLEEYARISIR